MSEAVYQKIVLEEGPEASAALVAQAKKVADALASGDAGSETGKAQIRAIFDEIRQIEALWLTQPQQAVHRLHLLEPKMVYRQTRSQGLKPLVEALKKAADTVLQEKDQDRQRAGFRRMVEFAEAVLAFYTAASRAGERGGRR